MRVMLLVVLLAATACEAPEVTSVPDAEQDIEEVADSAEDDTDQEPEESEPQPEDPEPTPEEPAEVRAAVGDAITLRGSDEALQVRATVTSIIDPGTPPGEFMEPGEGMRYVAIDVQLENVGTSPYSDSPDNGAQLIDQDNRQHNTTFGDVSECQTFGGSVTMAPGDVRAGCLVFEVPAAAAVRSFQFTLDSGFAPQTGVWDL